MKHLEILANMVAIALVTWAVGWYLITVLSQDNVQQIQIANMRAELLEKHKAQDVSEFNRQEAEKKALAEQNEILDKLAFCESSNMVKAVHYNDGAEGLHSYGLFQFQPPTVKEKWYQYTGEKINTARAIEIAKDPTLSRELAHYTIFVRHEWNRWGCWKLINK